MKDIEDKKREKFIYSLKNSWELPDSWDVQPDSIYTNKICFTRSKVKLNNKNISHNIKIVISKNGFFISKDKETDSEKNQVLHKFSSAEHAAIYTRGIIDGIERLITKID